jgi:cell division protein FtsZ
MPTPRKNLVEPTDPPHRPRLKLLGVGGAGGNAIAQIAAAVAGDANHPLAGVELIAINTDVQALQAMTGAERVSIGAAVTHGLGAGGDAELGQRAAQQDAERLEALAQNSDIVFLVTGLGAGTGTGAAPIVAHAARSQGALVLAFAFLPFSFEGDRRRQQALAGLEALKQKADAVVAIPNDKIFKLAGDHATALEAFQRANELCATGVQAFWQLLSRKGLVNVDFADLRTALGGKRADGIFGIGTGCGDHKVREAVKAALDHPLLDGGELLAKSDAILVSVLGGPDLTLADVQHAVEPVSRAASRAHVIMGAAMDEAHTGRLTLTILAAGNLVPRRVAQAASPRQITGRNSPLRLGSNLPAPTALPDPETKSNGKKPAAPKQESLPLDAMSKGRFEKGESTIYDGENLDVPTFLRRGVSLKR